MSALTYGYGPSDFDANSPAAGPTTWALFDTIKTYINSAKLEVAQLGVSKIRVPMVLSRSDAAAFDLTAADLEFGRFQVPIGPYATVKQMTIQSAAIGNWTTAPIVRLQLFTGGAWVDLATLTLGADHDNTTNGITTAAKASPINATTQYRVVILQTANTSTITKATVTLDLECTLRA